MVDDRKRDLDLVPVFDLIFLFRLLLLVSRLWSYGLPCLLQRPDRGGSGPSTVFRAWRVAIKREKFRPDVLTSKQSEKA